MTLLALFYCFSHYYIAIITAYTDRMIIKRSKLWRLLSSEDEIACAKMMKNSTDEKKDENDKVDCVPGWARRNNSYENTR